MPFWRYTLGLRECQCLVFIRTRLKRSSVSSQDCHEEERSREVSEEAHKQRLEQIKDTAATMEQCYHRIHTVRSEEICTCEHHHYQPHRKDHGGDGAYETWSIGLEPRRGIGRKCKGTTEANESSPEERVYKHLVDTHASFLSSNP